MVEYNSSSHGTQEAERKKACDGFLLSFQSRSSMETQKFTLLMFCVLLNITPLTSFSSLSPSLLDLIPKHSTLGSLKAHVHFIVQNVLRSFSRVSIVSTAPTLFKSPSLKSPLRLMLNSYP